MPDPLDILRVAYAQFDEEPYDLDMQGWGSDAPVFELMIRSARPRLIIEVGTWKGASAIHMASVCRDLRLETTIICVDTWLGALEFWTDTTDPERYGSLQRWHGYPQVYYQFLANVVKTGHKDTILPLPQTSAIAARWLAHHQIMADMVYIDGSHDYADVLADIRAYRPLVREGGVLFGDDYDWPDVREAVKDSKRPHTVVGRYWMMS